MEEFFARELLAEQHQLQRPPLPFRANLERGRQHRLVYRRTERKLRRVDIFGGGIELFRAALEVAEKLLNALAEFVCFARLAAVLQQEQHEEAVVQQVE